MKRTKNNYLIECYHAWQIDGSNQSSGNLLTRKKWDPLDNIHLIEPNDLALNRCLFSANDLIDLENAR